MYNRGVQPFVNAEPHHASRNIVVGHMHFNNICYYVQLIDGFEIEVRGALISIAGCGLNTPDGIILEVYVEQEKSKKNNAWTTEPYLKIANGWNTFLVINCRVDRSETKLFARASHLLRSSQSDLTIYYYLSILFS